MAGPGTPIPLPVLWPRLISQETPVAVTTTQACKQYLATSPRGMLAGSACDSVVGGAGHGVAGPRWLCLLVFTPGRSVGSHTTQARSFIPVRFLSSHTCCRDKADLEALGHCSKIVFSFWQKCSKMKKKKKGARAKAWKELSINPIHTDRTVVWVEQVQGHLQLPHRFPVSGLASSHPQQLQVPGGPGRRGGWSQKKQEASSWAAVGPPLARGGVNYSVMGRRALSCPAHPCG